MKTERDRERTRVIMRTVYHDESHLKDWVLVRIGKNETGFEEIVGYGEDSGQIKGLMEADIVSHVGHEYVVYLPTEEEGERMGDTIVSPDELSDEQYTSYRL